MGITLSAADRVRTLILIFLFAFVHPVKSQDVDYYKENYLRYTNYIYQQNIQTVILEPMNKPMSVPVITLKSGEKLRLKFDDLREDPGNFSYTFIHCSADWIPSRLSETEYLEGFYSEQIGSWRHSVSTRLPYFHYEVDFPTSNMGIKISGNYVLIVFDTSDPEKVYFTRRFFVREKNAAIEANIHQATNIDLRYSHHEVDFTLRTTLPLRNPYKDLRVRIVQNNRWDNVNKDLKPLFVNDGLMDFNLEDDNLFAGTNEFRYADVRTLSFQTGSMENIGIDSATGLSRVILKRDKRKGTERYSSQEDLNGYYQIRIYDDRDGDYEGEYLKLAFTLDAPEPFDSANVYVFGQISNWNLDTANRMTWSEKDHAYHLDMLVKQGYYNYQYLVQGSNAVVSASETEGDRFEASDEYAFYVYWEDPTLGYDRLVGHEVFYSRR